MRRAVRPAGRPLSGSVAMPGDKSISHRAVLFAAMARGTSSHTGVLDSEDVRATVTAVRALGAGVDVRPEGPGRMTVTISGWGAEGPREPDGPIDCGNSGSTARMLLGVVAGWPIEVTLTGDDSLTRRPMQRVTVPLTAMGAEFEGPAEGTLPIRVSGGPLHAMAHESAVASAQVKTALLVAGMRAEGRTTVREPALSRDHTERLLPAFGVPVGRADDGLSCWVEGPVVPRASGVAVPGDPSSSAFAVVAALIVPGSDVTVTGVSLNPTRTGYLRVLERMGADVRVTVRGETGAESVGDIRARRSPLRSTLIPAHEVPSLIDEIPILAVAAARAEGTTRFEGVRELRVKESDRLTAVAEGLGALGATVRAGDEWLEVEGPGRFGPADLDPHGDHRLAMAYAVAALAGTGEVRIERFESVSVSYPRFADDLSALGAGDAFGDGDEEG